MGWGRFKNLDKKTKYDLEKVNANKGLRLKTIADELSMSYEELKTINKHLLKEMVPADKNSYNLYIPHTKVELFNNKISNMKELAVTENKATLEKVKNDTNNKSSFDANKNSKDLNTNKIIHKVKQGDTLEAIAKKYKVSVKKLKIDNKKSSSKLKIGENIEIIK
jgi:membrane-bound lytic murein transglycosylase D